MESKENVYKNIIQKPAEELAKKCYQNGIPCMFVMAVGEHQNLNKENRRGEKDGRLELKILSYLPETLAIETKDTVFSDMINVVNGFTTVPPNDNSNFALDMDDLALPPDLEQET